MTSFTTAVKAAMFGACLSFVAPALAQDHVVARVSIAGIDLATPAGRATFDQRLGRAARQVCAMGDRTIAEYQAMNRCIGAMRRDADAQLAARDPSRTKVLAAR